MADKRKNSFRDMILIIFVVVACFGLTIYGIIYLAGKVFAPEEKIEMVKPKPAPNVTDPENGDILTFTSKAEKTPEEPSAQANTMPPAAQPVTKPKQEPVKQPEEKKVSIPTPPAKTQTEPQKREQPAVVKPAPVQQAPIQPTVKPVQEAPKAAASAQKSTVKGRYVVQIMSLKSQSAADKEALKFKNACPDVHVVKADLGTKGIWYRIRCGVTDSRTIANDTKNKIATEFKIAPQVVTNE